MENKTLREHIDYLIQCTENLHFKSAVFERYRKCYEEIFLYCMQNRTDMFSSHNAAEFCATYCCRQKEYFAKIIRKTAYTTAEYFKTGQFSWKKIDLTKYPVSQAYEELLEEFQLELLNTLSPGTVRVAAGTARQLLYFLEQNGVNCVTAITHEDIFAFIRRKAPERKASMSELLRTVRKFCRFLCSKNIAELDVERFLQTAGRCRQKALPCLENEEIEAVFSQIDRTTDKGRRDYAIFLLSLRTGLRACDISTLKLTDIHWEKRTISIVQKKTGLAMELPLPVDSGNAIADYILHSRYETDNPYLFLRVQKTHNVTPICSTSFNTYFRQYLKKAGIECRGWDGKTFHALRRTAGTSLVKSGVPVSTVAQILGHRNIESSKRYISLDTEGLRQCSLDLGDMNTKKEGLI